MSIVRKIFNKNTKPLNILTAVSHERYEPTLCLTDNIFWSIERKGETRNWKVQYAPIPKNYTILEENELPSYIDFDLMISHNPYVHIPLLNGIRTIEPLINVFHTMPTPGWTKEHVKKSEHLFETCQHHVYISEFNRLAWQLEKDNYTVIHHGIDSDLFQPILNEEKRPTILTIANDFINRDWALGFSLWKYIISNGFNYKVIGDTPNLSKPAKNTEELIHEYQTSLIYINTSLHSPIPMSVLEAMSVGCCVVSTNTCMLPDIIEHEKDGFLYSPKDPSRAIKYIKHLLSNPNEAIEIGKNSRKKIQTMFSIENFINNWNKVINNVCSNYNG